MLSILVGCAISLASATSIPAVAPRIIYYREFEESWKPIYVQSSKVTSQPLLEFSPSPISVPTQLDLLLPSEQPPKMVGAVIPKCNISYRAFLYEASILSDDIYQLPSFFFPSNAAESYKALFDLSCKSCFVAKSYDFIYVFRRGENGSVVGRRLILNNLADCPIILNATRNTPNAKLQLSSTSLQDFIRMESTQPASLQYGAQIENLAHFVFYFDQASSEWIRSDLNPNNYSITWNSGVQGWQGAQYPTLPAFKQVLYPVNTEAVYLLTPKSKSKCHYQTACQRYGGSTYQMPQIINGALTEYFATRLETTSFVAMSSSKLYLYTISNGLIGQSDKLCGKAPILCTGRPGSHSEVLESNKKYDYMNLIPPVSEFTFVENIMLYPNGNGVSTQP